MSVRGGDRLRRFVTKAADPEIMGRAMAKIIRQYVLPIVRGRAPRRSGRLQGSLRIVQRGAAVELRGVFYGRFVRFGDDGQQTMDGLVMDVIEERADAIRAALSAEIVRELTR